MLQRADPQNIRAGDSDLVLFDPKRNRFLRDTEKDPLQGFEIHLDYLNLLPYLQLPQVLPGLFVALFSCQHAWRDHGEQKNRNSHPPHDSHC